MVFPAKKGNAPQIPHPKNPNMNNFLNSSLKPLKMLSVKLIRAIDVSSTCADNDVEENVNVGVIEGGRDAVAIKPIATYNLHELVNEQTININNKANDEFNFQNIHNT